MSLILSVNSGSSSLKFKMFQMPAEEVVVSGQIERIGKEDAYVTLKFSGNKVQETRAILDHKQAVDYLLKQLVELGIVPNTKDIKGVGHRVVHGGELYHQSAKVDDQVLEDIEKLCELAPLHNPVNLMGIRAFQEVMPQAVHTVVFDTAFHQTMEAANYLYPIPYRYYEKYKIRRYGFHGTSHYYVSRRAAELMGRPVDAINIISAHLGNGASITAVASGKSIDTSMGFTPLAGIMMGTRSGDVDPAILPYIMEREALNTDEILDILNHKSGMYGVSGISSDARDIIEAKNAGNKRAELTLELYANRVAETIGSYFVKLGTVDALLFTGGIGENSGVIRELILRKVEKAMRLKINDALNNDVIGKEACISLEGSASEVWVVPTDEELVIARDTFAML